MAVATNQSGIGRGLFDMATLNAIHDKMHRAVCRQGRAHRRALLLPAHGARAVRLPQAAHRHVRARSRARFHTDLKGVPVVGDSLRDLQAAEQVGAQPILVLTGKGKKTREAGGLPKKTIVFDSLADAARHLVQHP